MEKEKESLEIQSILRQQYLKGPNFMMDGEKGIGINCFSGDGNTNYYELYGQRQVYRIIISKLPVTLFTTKYIGKQILFLLMHQDDVLLGGPISLNYNITEELERVFVEELSQRNILELQELWKVFVYKHFTNSVLTTGVE